MKRINMHRIEGHHFASPFFPLFPGNGKQWIYGGDLVEIVGFPTGRVSFLVLEKGQFPLGKRGAKATQDGAHDLLHV